jgi:D-lactate dehydrogenase
VCPSRNVTTTPRQRIVIRREMARQPAGSPVYDALLHDYEHDAVQTCAADGSCLGACPVAIDTGELMKEFRRRERGEREEAVALALAKRYAGVERAVRGALRGARLVEGLGGRRLLRRIPSAIRQRLSSELVPTLPAKLPPPASAHLPASRRAEAAAVYLPACLNRMLGGEAGGEFSLPAALLAISQRAGLPLWIPPDVAGHCCATPWSSKGYRRGQEHMAARTAVALWRWSEEGRLPVVIDASSCAQGLVEDIAPCLMDAERERFAQIEILDSISWVHDRLLASLTVSRRVPSVAVHPTCAAGRLGLAGKLEQIAGALADEVLVPAGSTCCGMAGDRGLLHPELPISALRDAAAELAEHPAAEHICSNRTCEIALQQVTGEPYASFVLLLERLTRP